MAETLPPPSDAMHTRHPSRPLDASTSFSWWSWRPGISPIRALLIGLPLLMLALAFDAAGLYMLVSSVIDAVSTPTRHSGSAGIFAILISLLMLPYALFLTFGGWHDLRGQKQTVTGNIIARRTTATNILQQGRPARPGISTRLARAWYGVALLPIKPPEQATQQQVVIFRLSEDHYRDLREGVFVQVVYTPHLRHVTSLKQVNYAG